MRIGISLGVMMLPGMTNLAVAGPIYTGSYSYGLGGTAAAILPSCGSNGTFNDDGTISEDGGFQDLNLYITACQNPAPDYTATFTITDGGSNTLTGTVSGFDTGEENPEGLTGTFTVTSAVGDDFDGADGFTDNFFSSTTVDFQTGTGVGTFIVGAPEPASLALCGFGALALGLLRRRRA